MATGTFKFQADLALCLRCCWKVVRRFQMLLSQGHAVPHHCNSSRDCTALPAGGAEMDADRQIWQQKHIWLTSDTEWFIPFWFQFIIVYQCLSAVQTRFRSSFRSVSAFTHLGCSKSCQAESSHLNQPQSSIQSFHVAKSGHIGSYGFSWWIQRCCFDEALHFNTSWWALDHGGGRKDEFWWCMYGLPYDVWWCM